MNVEIEKVSRVLDDLNAANAGAAALRRIAEVLGNTDLGNRALVASLRASTTALAISNEVLKWTGAAKAALMEELERGS